MSVSIFSAVHNRPEPLKYTVLSWLYRTVAEEIVLLDWCSDIPVKGIIEAAIKENCVRLKSELHDWQDRLKIIRVTNKVPWRIGYGSNTAASFTSHDTLFKIDADCILTAHRLPQIPAFGFMNGNMNCQHENDRGIFGSFIMHRKEYWNAGGIDERFKCYGQEDQDLFDRLQKEQGIQRYSMPEGTLYHLPHGNNRRTENYADTGTIWECTQRNREEAKNRKPWNTSSPRLQHKITSDQGWYKEIKIHTGQHQEYFPETAQLF